MSSHLFCKAPRAHLFTQVAIRRSFSVTRLTTAIQPPPFHSPSPPRLPKEEQELFESLQRESTGAFSTPRSPPKINQSPDASTADVAEADNAISDRVENVAESSTSKFEQDFNKAIEARGKGEELHPDVKRGAPPEFEGDRNPKTGEIGGPKNEPLRWGAAGEWSYNGRTTDF
jgi:Protein of unknown function (DUF1674)